MYSTWPLHPLLCVLAEAEFERGTQWHLHCFPCWLFTRKDRVTIQEKEREEMRQRQAEAEAKRVAEQRRRQTLKVCVAELSVQEPLYTVPPLAALARCKTILEVYLDQILSIVYVA